MTLRKNPGKAVCWEPTELVSTLLSAGARRVVCQWISSSAYLDDQNEPVLLMPTGEDAHGFASLVRQTNLDLAPPVILNELLRKGIVEQHVNGHLLLRRSAYAPRQPGQANRVRQSHAPNVAPARRRRFNDIG